MFDAGAAWAELAEMIETRDGWGSDRVLATMRKLETRHRIDESLLERTLRIYGGQLRLVLVHPVEGDPAGESEAVPPAAEDAATSPIARGGHDEQQYAAERERSYA